MDISIAHLTSWYEPAKGEVPLPLTGPSVTLSPLPAPSPPTIFLFGGKIVALRRLTSEMWAMDLTTRTWTRLDAGDGPGPRYFHSMDVWEDKLVCFGGMSDSESLVVHNDIWFFDCRSRRWMPQPSPDTGLGVNMSDTQDPSLIPQSRYAHLSAVSRGQLVVSGGQHSDNSWIFEINVYDFRRRIWTSKTNQPESQGMHSKGSYRSVAASSKQRVIASSASHTMASSQSTTYSIDEEGEGGEIWCYSNYDFAKVRRELEVVTPLDGAALHSPPSDKFQSPPSYTIRDETSRMRGIVQPPGLRFPTGGIVGDHFILCGLYLASTSAAFSIWTLNLTTMVWRHLDPSVLATGSWNRAVLCPETAKLLVFGNARSDLASDYSKRAVNLDHVAVIALETYGIYRPPKLEVPPKSQEVGLAVLEEKLASDFEVVCDDGRRIKCSRKILAERWPWFAEQQAALIAEASGIAQQSPALDINDTLLGSFTPARVAPSHLTIAEPFPVCVALVQYFYTLSLSTPLQNRPPVLSALLFLAKQYRIERLNKLVVHALHTRLDPSIAVGIYEIATLAGEQNLQARALSMIHSAKNGGSTSRSHRQGPGSGQISSDAGQSNQPNPSGGGSHPDQSNSQPSSLSTAGFTDESGAPYRRARADSVTVPEDILLGKPEPDESADMDAVVDQLLAALNIGSIPRPESSIVPHAVGSTDPSPCPPVPPRFRRRPPSLAPPDTPLPTPYQPSFTRSNVSTEDNYTRPGSPTSSEATSNNPRTPAESLRDSGIFSRDQFPIIPTPHAYSSTPSTPSKNMALPSLPEYTRAVLDAPGRFPGKQAVQSRERTLVPSSEHSSPPPRLPPQSLGSQQAQAINALTASNLDARRSGSGSSSGHPSLSYNGMFNTSSVIKHHPSIGSMTSSYYSDGGLRNYAHKAAATFPETMSRSDISIDFAQPPPSLSRTETVMSRDQWSLSSGSTGVSAITHLSGKKAEKAAKKAAEYAAKAEREAEKHARFQALRAEQQRKMAIGKAQVQRQEEIAKQAAAAKLVTAAAASTTAKPEAKSKFGRFGAKFADAVLFPSAGGENSMF